MISFERLIAYGLIATYAKMTNKTPKQVLDEWIDGANILLPSTSARTKCEITDADVNEIYAAYPTRDGQNGNRPLSKGAKSKRMIRSILERGDVTKEDFLKVIQQEVDANKKDGKWLKDFNTFLNNLPELQEEQPKPKEEARYSTLW